MAPSGVNDSGRGVMSAVKRFFNRLCGLDNAGALLSTAGGATVYTLTFTNAPASLFTSLIVGFKVNLTCAVDPTLNVNGLGAVNVQKMTASGYTNLAAGDWFTGQHVWCKYDGTLAKWIMLTPTATLAGDPMTTRGDIIHRNASNLTVRLPIGAANTLLGSDGTDSSYRTIIATLEGLSATQGQIGYRGAAAWAALAVNTSGKFLQTQGAAADPQWADGARVLDKTGVNLAIDSTSAETTLYSVLIPANALGANGTARITIKGEYSNDTGAGRTFTLRVKFGATTLYADASASITNASTGRPFMLDLLLVNQNNTAQQLVNGVMSIGNVAAATTGQGDLATAPLQFATFQGNSAIDSTSAQTFSVTIQHSFSDASLRMSRLFASAELI